MGIEIGMVVYGFFSEDFVRLFQLHPDVDEVVVADMVKARVKQPAETYRLKRYYCYCYPFAIFCRDRSEKGSSENSFMPNPGIITIFGNVPRFPALRRRTVTSHGRNYAGTGGNGFRQFFLLSLFKMLILSLNRFHLSIYKYREL